VAARRLTRILVMRRAATEGRPYNCPGRSLLSFAKLLTRSRPHLADMGRLTCRNPEIAPRIFEMITEICEDLSRVFENPICCLARFLVSFRKPRTILARIPIGLRGSEKQSETTPSVAAQLRVEISQFREVVRSIREAISRIQEVNPQIPKASLTQ